MAGRADFTIRGDTSLDNKGVKTGLNSMSVAAGQVLAQVTMTVARTMGEIATAGIKYNAQMESYLTNFTTLFKGNKEIAEAQLEAIKETAATTPLAVESLTGAAQTLLAFGAANEDTLVPTLRMLGDVALGDKDKLQSLSLAFGQMSSTGKLMGQDLLQMINAGFNPLVEISKITGESMADLKDRMSAGGISAEEVANAFEHATSEGGQFYGAMEAQSKTFNGQMSTMKDNAKATLGAITEDISSGLSEDVMPAVNEGIAEILESAQEEGAAGAFETAAAIVQGLIDSFIEKAPDMITSGSDIAIKIMEGIGEKGPDILMNGFRIVLSILQGIAENLPRLIVAGIEMVTKLIKGAKDHMPEILKTAGKIISTLVVGLVKKLPDIIKAGASLVLNLIWGLFSMIPEALKAAKELGEDIKEKFEEIDWLELGKNIILGIKDGIVEFASLLWDAAKDAAAGALNKVKDFLGIESPSKVARDEIGVQFSKGMAVGVKKAQGDTDKAAVDAAKSMVTSAKLAIDADSAKVGTAAASQMSVTNVNGANNSKVVNQYFYSKTTEPFDAYKEVVGYAL